MLARALALSSGAALVLFGVSACRRAEPDAKASGATLAAAASAPSAPSAPSRGTPMIDHEISTLDGKPERLSAYRGKVLLLVNTASKCGYTPQYDGLEKLHERYAAKGFSVLGFPCNDFGGQEPGSPEEIQTFCESKFHVTFPLFAKVKAKGPEKSPLYRTLTEETPDGIKGEIKWNFTKFLVDAQGVVVARFEPAVDPLSAEVTSAVEKLLAAK